MRKIVLSAAFRQEWIKIYVGKFAGVLTMRSVETEGLNVHRETERHLQLVARGTAATALRHLEGSRRLDSWVVVGRRRRSGSFGCSCRAKIEMRWTSNLVRLKRNVARAFL